MAKPIAFVMSIIVLLIPSVCSGDVSGRAAIHAAALKTGVPETVLFAVACAKSARSDRSSDRSPWPWTLTIVGKTRHYASREEAYAALTEALRLGVTHIDIGLFQVNWRRYQHRLDTPWRALDPTFNSRVAGSILRDKWRQSGNLWAAVGHYQTATPLEASAFREQIGSELVRLLASEATASSSNERTDELGG